MLGRKLEHAEQNSGQAQAIARCFDRQITGEAYAVEWHDPQSIQPAFERWEPDLVVQMASHCPTAVRRISLWACFGSYDYAVNPITPRTRCCILIKCNCIEARAACASRRASAA